MKRALLIGNNYPGTDMTLSGCVNDIKDVAKVLKKRGFEAITSLSDKKATWNAMTQGLLKAVLDCAPGDLLVIWYSGHGTYVKDLNGDEKSGNDQCWVPYDIRKNGPIIDDEIYAILRKKKTGVWIVVFSDSCFSGTVLKAFNLPRNGTPRFLPPSKFLSPAIVAKLKKAAPENIIDDDTINRDVGGTILLFAGCQDKETSADAFIDGRYNGAFTYYTLKALDEMPAGSTYKQWFKKIRTYLPSDDYDQSPNLYGAGMMGKIFE